MRTLWVAFLLAVCVPNVLAQSIKPPLAVHIIGKTEDSERITQAISARVGSTTRYTVGNSESELWMFVTCFALEKIVTHPSTQGMDGYVCFYRVEYFPAQLKPFQSLLTNNLISGKFGVVVEDIFDAFVSATRDEVLNVGREGIMLNVRSFCQDPEHKSVCGQSKQGR
jgi:hypothetical protein